MLVVGKPDDEKTFEERKAELIMAKQLRMGTAVIRCQSIPSREMTPSMYLPNGNQVKSSGVSHTKKTKMSVIVDGKKQNKEQAPKINVAAVKAASNPIALRYWQMCNQPSQPQVQEHQICNEPSQPQTQEQPRSSCTDNQLPSRRNTCSTNQQPSCSPNYRITDQSCPPTFRMRDNSLSKTINNNQHNDILPPWMEPGFDSPPIMKKIPIKQPYQVKVKTKDNRWNPPEFVASKKLPGFEETNREPMAMPSQLPEDKDAEKSCKLMRFPVHNKKDGHSTKQHSSQNLNQLQPLQTFHHSNNQDNSVKLPNKYIQTNVSCPPPPQALTKHQHTQKTQMLECNSQISLDHLQVSNNIQQGLAQNQHQHNNEQRPQERQSRPPRRPPPPNFQHKGPDSTFRRSKNIFIPHPSNCTPSHPSNCTPSSPEVGRPARPQSPQIQITNKQKTYENTRMARPETPEIQIIPRPWSPPAAAAVAYPHNVPWITSNSQRERSSSLPPWVKQEKDPFWTRTQLIKTNGN